MSDSVQSTSIRHFDLSIVLFLSCFSEMVSHLFHQEEPKFDEVSRQHAFQLET